jgi:hypothetical protein
MVTTATHHGGSLEAKAETSALKFIPFKIK